MRKGSLGFGTYRMNLFFVNIVHKNFIEELNFVTQTIQKENVSIELLLLKLPECFLWIVVKFAKEIFSVISLNYIKSMNTDEILTKIETEENSDSSISKIW